MNNNWKSNADRMTPEAVEKRIKLNTLEAVKEFLEANGNITLDEFKKLETCCEEEVHKVREEKLNSDPDISITDIYAVEEEWIPRKKVAELLGVRSDALTNMEEPPNASFRYFGGPLSSKPRHLVRMEKQVPGRKRPEILYSKDSVIKQARAQIDWIKWNKHYD